MGLDESGLGDVCRHLRAALRDGDLDGCSIALKAVSSEFKTAAEIVFVLVVVLELREKTEHEDERSSCR
jgi:hypothetical protein